MRLRIRRYLDRITDRRPVVRISRSSYRKRHWPKVLAGPIAALVVAVLVVTALVLLGLAFVTGALDGTSLPVSSDNRGQMELLASCQAASAFSS